MASPGRDFPFSFMASPMLIGNSTQSCLCWPRERRKKILPLVFKQSRVCFDVLIQLISELTIIVINCTDKKPNLQIKAGMSDAADAIFNGLQMVYPESLQLMCWMHVFIKNVLMVIYFFQLFSTRFSNSDYFRLFRRKLKRSRWLIYLEIQKNWNKEKSQILAHGKFQGYTLCVFGWIFPAPPGFIYWVCSMCFQRLFNCYLKKICHAWRRCRDK